MNNVSSFKTMFLMLVLIGFSIFLFYWQFSFYQTNYSDEMLILSIGSKKYDLGKPDQKYLLHDDLREISGLSYYQKNQLACIQDEDGVVFIYDLQKSKLVSRGKFGDKGDFESVEIVRDTAYVLKSNGNIYYFPLFQSETKKTKIIKTGLSSKNDTEGLAYIIADEKIAIVCKGSNSHQMYTTDNLAIYTVDLKSKSFNPQPDIELSLDDIRTSLDSHGLDRKNHLPFNPSAIALHPITQEIILLSSTGKLLLKTDLNGKIVSTIPLHRKVFSQPEGICFDPDGTLYISSEGKSGPGYILQFNPRQ